MCLLCSKTQAQSQAPSTQYIQYSYDAAGNPINKKNFIVGTGCSVVEEARIAKPKDIIKELSDAEIKKQFGIAVSPNPTKDLLNVSFDKELLDDYTNIIIYSALGKVVLQTKVQENSVALDLGAYTPGVYYLRLQTKDVSLQYIVEKL
jgi:hypothetical protein